MMDAGVFIGILQGGSPGMGEQGVTGEVTTVDGEAFKSLILSILGGKAVNAEASENLESTGEEVTMHPSQDLDDTEIPADILSLFQGLSEPISGSPSTANDTPSNSTSDKSALIPVTQTAGASDVADSKGLKGTEKPTTGATEGILNDEIPKEQADLKDRLFIGSEEPYKEHTGTVTDILAKKTNTVNGKHVTNRDGAPEPLIENTNTTNQKVMKAGTPDTLPDDNLLSELAVTGADESSEQTEKESTTGEEGIKSHPLAEDGGPDVHETQETGRGENFSHTLKTEAESQADDSETIRMPGRIKVSPEKIEVRVDTDKLGRIDLSVGHRAGELTAQIGVDRLQSLIEIQKNLPQLFTSLSEEGWSNGNFTFFLKDESRQGKDNKGIGKTVITKTGQASLTQGRGAYHHQGALSIRV